MGRKVSFFCNILLAYQFVSTTNQSSSVVKKRLKLSIGGESEGGQCYYCYIKLFVTRLVTLFNFVPLYIQIRI